MLWLDALTANVDRSWRNPNLLRLARRPVGHRPRRLPVSSTTAGPAGSAPRRGSRPSRTTSPTTCWSGYLDGVPEADAALAPLVTRDLLEEVVALVPDVWLEPMPGAETPDALRAAYVEFLLARVAGERAWLPVEGAA